LKPMLGFMKMNCSQLRECCRKNQNSFLGEFRLWGK
jgi:hypothetical protein